jgi:DNA-binding transcriptional ArsR family regulator
LTNLLFNRNIRRLSAVDVVSAPFSPLRSAVLAELRTPSSATEVAARLGETRQRVNYHVRSLEKAGLAELVEERPRRGCTERVMRATCHAVVVEPQVVGEVPAAQDRFAADTVVAGGARLVRDVAAARAAAAERGQRLLTFAIEAEVGFERPADVERFTDALADRIAELAAEFGPGRRRYRIFLGGIPA